MPPGGVGRGVVMPKVNHSSRVGHRHPILTGRNPPPRTRRRQIVLTRRGHSARRGAPSSGRGQPARAGTGFRSPTASNAPARNDTHPAASIVPGREPQRRHNPGQHCGPGPHHGGRARATRQRSVSSTEATNSRASCPSQCGSPSRSRTRAQAARASSRSPRSACRRASMHRARDAESRSSVSM